MSQNIAVVIRAFGKPEYLYERINAMVDSADDPMSLHFYIILDEADPDLIEFSQIQYETNVYREYVILKDQKEMSGFIAKLPSKGYNLVIWGNVNDPMKFDSHWDTDLRKGVGK